MKGGKKTSFFKWQFSVSLPVTCTYCFVDQMLQCQPLQNSGISLKAAQPLVVVRCLLFSLCCTILPSLTG